MAGDEINAIVTNQDLLAAIKANTSETRDIKKSVESICNLIEDLTKEVSSLKCRVSDLEKKNSMLEGKLEYNERKARKNNFVIYNIPEVNDRKNENLIGTVKEFCNEMGVELADHSLSDCFRLGRGTGPRPILVVLNNNIVKQTIMKKSRELRSINHRISHDRTRQEREEGKQIYTYLSKLKTMDPNASYFRNQFKFRGGTYSQKEISEIFVTTSDQGSIDNLEQLQTIKRKRIEDQLKDFRFRPKSDSVSQ